MELKNLDNLRTKIPWILVFLFSFVCIVLFVCVLCVCVCVSKVKVCPAVQESCPDSRILLIIINYKATLWSVLLFMVYIATSC